ncbi:RraA family protein [Amycolatopsis rubida]|uniref:Putative 4-hydroxy-4-methyl-2-oxoglutarate aldolase n=1 Tax=Amycolatopsis rubida TaxID=112413 RepID=A0A1I5IC24_9PSEU|nr:dimethylmenaquinone methyltransferase [Amycolatopsis rubida]SFO58147.1 Regulator of RNase E activity RraA [Amycolatopsis rubida]
MDHTELTKRFATLTTAHLADACLRARLTVRCAPAGTRGVIPGLKLGGRVRPARHSGSVDVFLEAITAARPGDVLVADNQGRQDESCVGDLITAEVASAGLSGIVIWGLHRDTAELREIGLPVYSLGSLPTGPLHLHDRAASALESATVGEWTVTTDDLVFGDDDGVLFVPAAQADDVFRLAESIRDTEHRQAAKIRDGVTLREQVRFSEFLSHRETDPSYTFRRHLRVKDSAIEE